MLNEILDRATEWILKSQKKDGGFPFPDINNSSACWLTSEALSALICCGIEATNPQYVKGIEWLIEKQNQDGGWPVLNSGESTTESTSWGALSLILSGIKIERAIKAIKCLISLQDDSGGWPRARGGLPTPTMTSMAIMALEEAKSIEDSFAKSLEFAYKWMHKKQLSGGGWPTLVSKSSDVAPASYFLFGSRNSTNSLAIKSRQKVLDWFSNSDLVNRDWINKRKWCSYEIFNDLESEWPRRKYFAVPYAISALLNCESLPDGFIKLVRLLFQAQSSSGRWSLSSEVGEENYTWYTYVTAFALGSIPPSKKKELDKMLKKSISMSETKRKIFAIVVGVSEYDDRGLETLNCSLNDSKAISKWLQSYNGGQVSVVTLNKESTSKPTYSQILGNIEKLIRELQNHKDCTFIFYFSGHGKNLKGKDYILPSDFSDDAPVDTAISIERIMGGFRMLPIKSVFIIDSCRDEFSKGIISQKIIRLFERKKNEHAGIVTFFSCTKGKKSFELPDEKIFEFKGLGAFTLAFLYSLDPRQAKQKSIVLEEIIRRLPKQMIILQEKHNKPLQVPQINFENHIIANEIYLPCLNISIPRR